MPLFRGRSNPTLAPLQLLKAYEPIIGELRRLTATASEPGWRNGYMPDITPVRRKMRAARDHADRWARSAAFGTQTAGDRHLAISAITLDAWGEATRIWVACLPWLYVPTDAFQRDLGEEGARTADMLIAHYMSAYIAVSTGGDVETALRNADAFREDTFRPVAAQILRLYAANDSAG